MAVTILERPEGHILNPTGIDNTIIFLSPSAGITELTHGYSTGDVIYIQSRIESYNGFVQIEVINANQFRLKDLLGNYIDYLQQVETTYYLTTLEHGWSAVHLPITYRLSNDLYPTNSVDTSRNINSVQDANGFTVLQLSGSLGSVHTFDFIKVTAPNDTDLSKVYQIVEFISPTVVIINLEYDSANNFTSATAIKYYNNYNIQVRVYAGINASHEWTAQKPYELAATLQFIPDEDNEAFFSINELLKSYIETRNNLTLGTLPNNIDFWNNFYIEVAESYDDSDGYTFGTYTSSFTSDQSNFEGTAVNAKLVFKNIHSGYLSEYLMTNNTAKFLTLFTIPVLFSCGSDTPDCYQDISFIVPDGYAVATLQKEFYVNGNGPVTVNDTISEESGVIRVPLDADCDYDRVDVTLLGGAQLLDEPDFAATGNWLQTATADADWTISGGMASVEIGGAIIPIESEYLYQTISGTSGDFRIKADVSTTDGGGVDDWQVEVYVIFFNGGTGGSTVKSQLLGTLKAAGVGNIPTISYDATVNVAGAFDTIAVYAFISALPQDGTVTVHLLDVEVYITDDEISETKQFLIDCNCGNQELRLTWLNNLGGFDYWAFTGKKDDIVEIQEAMTTKKNILPTWPKSYGEDADTIRKQTLRVSNKAYTVRSQFVTEEQIDALAYIKSSVLVQIINSRTDRRTVIVDTDSFVIRKDGDKTHEIAFNISFTDDIPSQTV